MKASEVFFHHYLPNHLPKFPKRRRPTAAEAKEIRVCTNRTCRRQGSLEILRVLSDLAPPDVAVNSCGCLGRCGAGPNVAVLPPGVIVGHCGTAARAARVMCEVADASDDDVRDALDAVALRRKAEGEFEMHNFSQAELLLSQAVDLKPFGGLHIIYKCRSVARLAMGNYLLALEDAREALKLAPQYVEGYMCEGDALMAMDQYDAAEKSYSMCLQIDPLIRRSKSFKTRVGKLQEKLTASNACYNQQ